LQFCQKRTHVQLHSRRVSLLKRSLPLKSQVFCTKTTGKMLISGIDQTSPITSSKIFFRQETLSCPAHTGSPRKSLPSIHFPMFSHIGTQTAAATAQQAQFLFQLVAEVGLDHVMLILQMCRVQELPAHRSFH
jgi:hypothetical protein